MKSNQYVYLREIEKAHINVILEFLLVMKIKYKNRITRIFDLERSEEYIFDLFGRDGRLTVFFYN